MRVLLYIFLLILIIASCGDNKQEVGQSAVDTVGVADTSFIEEQEVESFISFLKLDTALIKPKMDMTILHSGDKTDTLYSFCNCEKDVKNNTLKIQLRTSLPPQSLIDKGEKAEIVPPVGLTDSLQIQYRFLTFHLKDSIMEKAELLKVSTENQFDGLNKEIVNIDKFKVRVNKFNYKIADEVWGLYKVIIPSEFGYTRNDSLIIGTFHCNNWRIVNYDELDSFVSPVDFDE